MRTLTATEIHSISGGNLPAVMTTVGGIAGASYGALMGASLAAPFAATGFVFAIAAPTVIWEGVAFSAGILVAGTLSGALIGGILGAGVVSATDYAIDTVMSNTSY